MHADVYLAGTVMLIFGMGLYGLFISNASNDLSSGSDRALQGSSLFGMFALKVIPIPAKHPTSSDVLVQSSRLNLLLNPIWINLV
jgi:hypothetical protein